MHTLERPSSTQPTPTSNQDYNCFAVVVPPDRINITLLCPKMFILRHTRMVLVFLQDHNGVGSTPRLRRDHRPKLILHVSTTGHEVFLVFNNRRNSSCRKITLTSSVMA
jgi:hypothetical protein